MRVAEALLRTYRRLKEDRALLDYDDLILTTRDLLRRPGSAPWVLFKLDGGLDHILIDEAQDTNPGAMAGGRRAGRGVFRRRRRARAAIAPSSRSATPSNRSSASRAPIPARSRECASCSPAAIARGQVARRVRSTCRSARCRRCSTRSMRCSPARMPRRAWCRDGVRLHHRPHRDGRRDWSSCGRRSRRRGPNRVRLGAAVRAARRCARRRPVSRARSRGASRAGSTTRTARGARPPP